MNEFRRLIAGAEQGEANQTIGLEAMLDVERRTVER
jgi:hypothetical protein